MTASLDKATDKWTVGWNKPGWSANLANTVEYANFQQAHVGFVGILHGEGNRLVLSAYQRSFLTATTLILNDLNVAEDIERRGGEAILVGGTLFWIALL